ncbi:MAG: SCO family protein [Rhodospirillaceae bacterium]|nr:SCO family protein [Rhodospirillaceae bacterium]
MFILFAGTGIWMVSQSKKAGEASLIGGPFELTDHTGRTVTEADFAGTHKLVYFGYTFCPDICPSGLTTISTALDLLGEHAKQVKPLFITVDPKRDTVSALASYYEHFHPSFSNLTGTPEQVALVAQAYRVFYRKTNSGDTTDYLMDHSTVTYLMAPDGEYITHFGHDVTPERLAAAILNVF